MTTQQKEYTLIANSGIQLFTFSLTISAQEKFALWFRESYDKGKEDPVWVLDLLQELKFDEGNFLYEKKLLYKYGYMAELDSVTKEDIECNGINSIERDPDLLEDNERVYKIGFWGRDDADLLGRFENKWLPLPYFRKKTGKKFDLGPLNWSRIKLIRETSEPNEIRYTVLLAFDTRTRYKETKYKECPVFPDVYAEEMDFALCENEMQLMSFCSEENASYIPEYLEKIVFPDMPRAAKSRGLNKRMMGHIAMYVFLMDYLATKKVLPVIRLFKDEDVAYKEIDMVVDIGNSKTTALLIEDSHNFNQVRPLALTDLSNPVGYDEEGNPFLQTYPEPFDMRLVFRKASFGAFGINDSKQFVYPSLVRLGQEANFLMHRITSMYDGTESMSTYSSPKRFLWDDKPSTEEWRFLVFPGEKDEHVLALEGITNQLDSSGRIAKDGLGGVTYNYSRRTLMTFAFLEMLVQARSQLNGHFYRQERGEINKPRKIKRIIITCPTAMSQKERDALHQCARDAVSLLTNFENEAPAASKKNSTIEVVPGGSAQDSPEWYYDEATCAQLVYMYGEIGYKYKGCCKEFFDLYGRKESDGKTSLTVGTLDIGAGTTDLMVSKYTYADDGLVVVEPEPLFYDSFYFAGDDMLKALIRNLMIVDEGSAFRKKMKSLSPEMYRKTMKDFFGPDHNGQTFLERRLRGEFNLQYSVPLMCHFLELEKKGEKSKMVSYHDVFAACPPNPQVLEEFRNKFGFDLEVLDWEFDSRKVSEVIRGAMEPLLKQIATIMFAKACDMVLLSGRPASLPPIRDTLLKYYPVSPNRLILLNGYYVGEWYPFGENTGRILDPKTVVAMGGVIGFYGSEFSNLDTFSLKLDKLQSNLKSTVKFVKKAQGGQTNAYVLSPEKNQGDVRVNKLPEYLSVRQLGLDFYPERALFTIDFDRNKLASSIRKNAVDQDYTDSWVQAEVEDKVNQLKKRMPFTVSLTRENEQWEDLTIDQVLDKNGETIADTPLDISIQSLGVGEQRYWLDSGIFEF